MSERIVAGAPVKHAPIVLISEQVAHGVWYEYRSDGSHWYVCDLTSWLWTFDRLKAEKPKRKRLRQVEL